MAERGNEERTAKKPAGLLSSEWPIRGHERHIDTLMILPQRTAAKPPEERYRWYPDKAIKALEDDIAPANVEGMTIATRSIEEVSTLVRIQEADGHLPKQELGSLTFTKGNSMESEVFRYSGSGREPKPWERPAFMLGQGGTSLEEWWDANGARLHENLALAKAVLIRNAPIRGADDFSLLVERICPDGKLPYLERSTTRNKVSDRIYNSTEYPKQKKIELHSENTFQSQWPRKIFFYANKTGFTGGQTPIAYTRAILETIPEDILEEFSEKKLMYLRNFGGGLEIDWKYAFQTGDKEEVEKYCREREIAFEWKSGDRLRTKQILPAILVCGEPPARLWLNQAHLFHISNLDPTIRGPLLKALGPENLPRNVRFGDGTEIPEHYFDCIRSAIRNSTLEFDWVERDLLVLDNRHVSHGRNSFEGERQILVAMGEPDSYSNYRVVENAMES